MTDPLHSGVPVLPWRVCRKMTEANALQLCNTAVSSAPLPMNSASAAAITICRHEIGYSSDGSVHCLKCPRVGKNRETFEKSICRPKVYDTEHDVVRLPNGTFICSNCPWVGTRRDRATKTCPRHYESVTISSTLKVNDANASTVLHAEQKGLHVYDRIGNTLRVRCRFCQKTAHLAHRAREARLLCPRRQPTS
jgi:hypothetical protein